jgi:hypothetical protein
MLQIHLDDFRFTKILAEDLLQIAPMENLGSEKGMNRHERLTNAALKP